jgi:hypothetical protein
MKLSGLQDLLPFINFLREEKIWYKLDCEQDDAIMVSLTVVGARIEVYFYDELIGFSVFSGSEAVVEDSDLLFRIIREHRHGSSGSVQ